jgi:hypothetical protein
VYDDHCIQWAWKFVIIRRLQTTFKSYYKALCNPTVHKSRFTIVFLECQKLFSFNRIEYNELIQTMSFAVVARITTIVKMLACWWIQLFLKILFRYCVYRKSQSFLILIWLDRPPITLFNHRVLVLFFFCTVSRKSIYFVKQSEIDFSTYFSVNLFAGSDFLIIHRRINRLFITSLL